MQLPSLSSLLSYVPKVFEDRPVRFKLPVNRINDIAAVPPHTPDLGILQGREHHLLFDYGQRLDLDKVCDGYSANRMCLWNRRDTDKDGISAVAFKAKGQHCTSVQGRVYTVRVNDLVKLDNQRMNGVLFRRKRVGIHLPALDSTSKAIGSNPAFITAWAYIGVPTPWKEEIEYDTGFYRGYGEYRRADIFPASEDLRRYMVKDHYKWQPFIDQYKPATSTHLRSAGIHKHVRDIDRQHEKNQRHREARAAARAERNNNNEQHR